MTDRKTKKFGTLAEHLQKTADLANIAVLVRELNRITALLHKAFPELAAICHCGAIDYANDLLVLFTNNNSSFYQVNNRVPQIQDFMYAHGISIGKLLVKVSPQQSSEKPRTKHHVGDAEYAMLAKFAVAIDRPDLLKPQRDPEDNQDTSADEVWQVRL